MPHLHHQRCKEITVKVITFVLINLFLYFQGETGRNFSGRPVQPVYVVTGTGPCLSITGHPQNSVEFGPRPVPALFRLQSTPGQLQVHWNQQFSHDLVQIFISSTYDVTGQQGFDVKSSVALVSSRALIIATSGLSRAFTTRGPGCGGLSLSVALNFSSHQIVMQVGWTNKIVHWT